jgi:hypothetical protein
MLNESDRDLLTQAKKRHVQDITSNTQGMTDLQTTIWIKFVKSLAGADERDIMNLVVKSLQECSKETVGELSKAKEAAPHDIAKVLLEHRLHYTIQQRLKRKAVPVEEHSILYPFATSQKRRRPDTNRPSKCTYPEIIPHDD